MLKGIRITTTSAAILALLVSCGRNPESTGTEYANQMYHSRSYEPYSQILDTNSEDVNTIALNPTKSNQRVPVKGTVHRKYYAGQPRTALAQEVMEYSHIPADSFDMASRMLKNPLAKTEQITEQGKVLYTRFCAPCHGDGGKGDGLVAEQYKGVPNYSTGRYATLSEGHIFHVITHGKGRMWPHGTQVNPDERWKIVRYVQTLQKAQ